MCVCVNNLPKSLLSSGTAGVELMTFRVASQHVNHYTTRPPQSMIHCESASPASSGGHFAAAPSNHVTPIIDRLAMSERKTVLNSNSKDIYISYLFSFYSGPRGIPTGYRRATVNHRKWKRNGIKGQGISPTYVSNSTFPPEFVNPTLIAVVSTCFTFRICSVVLCNPSNWKTY